MTRDEAIRYVREEFEATRRRDGLLVFLGVKYVEELLAIVDQSQAAST